MVKAIVRVGVCHVALMVNLRDTSMGMDSVKESSQVLMYTYVCLYLYISESLFYTCAMTLIM